MDDQTPTAQALIAESRKTMNSLLDLGNCGIQDLESIPELFTCTHLHTLILSKSWWDLKSFDRISSNNEGVPNRIRRIPEAISQLVNLRTLIASDLQIFDANSLAALKNLETLLLAGNPECKLDFLTTLVTLRNLDLDYNPVKDLSNFKALNKLEYLSLEESKVENITDITYLTRLQTLFMGTSKCKDFSPLSQLVNLHHLFIHSNKISDLKFLSNLKELRELGISNNEIKNLEPLRKLEKLEELNLANNRIVDVEPLVGLKNLKLINLSSNRVKEIPAQFFSNIDADVTLNAHHNGALNLSQNPIESPPIEILKQGRSSVLEYFRLVKKEGSENIYEAKLTFVGEGGAGKTSLQIRLLNPTAELPKAEVRTRGVEITDWNISTELGKREIVHIWDFGGQDMYFPVHRFFLTENCVYVLMASSRFRAHNFEYWIPSIFQFGGSSPIIIAQTCHNNHHEPWLADLKPFLEKSEFHIVKVIKENYFRLNLPTQNQGLEEIRKVITDQIRALPNFGKPVPPSFIKLRNALLQEMTSQPCMPFKEFAQYCTEIDGAFANDATLNLFAATMHELGALLWYQQNSELKEWIILNPEWAMKAVYALIDDAEIEQHNGHVSIQDFERLWSSDSYKHRHGLLKKMLEAFKIAFPKKHIKQNFLLPARQLDVPSDINWDLTINSLRLWINFSFMPKGIINQTSADLSRFILNDEDVWNTGVILKDKQHNSECLVIENSFDKRINVTSRGNDARSLLLSVLQSIENLISDYRGVTYEVLVPCRCYVCAVIENPPTIYKYSDLLRWSAKPNKVLTCNESGDLYTVDDFLRSVGLQIVTKEAADRKSSEKRSESVGEKSQPFSQTININMKQDSKQDTNVAVSVKVNLKENKFNQKLKDAIEELKAADEANKKWQLDLLNLLTEIHLAENATTTDEQKGKWLDVKQVWETMKISKDAKSIVETIPWLAGHFLLIPHYIQEVGKLFN